MERRYYDTPGRPPTAVEEPPSTTGHAHLMLKSGERIECTLTVVSDTLWEAHPDRPLTELDELASGVSSGPGGVKIRFVL